MTRATRAVGALAQPEQALPSGLGTPALVGASARPEQALPSGLWARSGSQQEPRLTDSTRPATCDSTDSPRWYLSVCLRWVTWRATFCLGRSSPAGVVP